MTTDDEQLLKALTEAFAENHEPAATIRALLYAIGDSRLIVGGYHSDKSLREDVVSYTMNEQYGAAGLCLAILARRKQLGYDPILLGCEQLLDEFEP